MQALDGVFHKQDGEARNKAIAEHGVAEMEPGKERAEQIRGEHAHSHGANVGHGVGSHFAMDRAQKGQLHQSGVDDRIAMGAAREAPVEG